MHSLRCVCKHAHGRNTHSGQTVRPPQTPPSWWPDMQGTARPRDRTLLSREKGVKSFLILAPLWASQRKVMSCMIPWMQDIRNGEVQRDKKRVGVCQRQGARDRDPFLRGAMKGSGSGQRRRRHSTVKVLEATEMFTVKWISLPYVNFISIKKLHKKFPEMQAPSAAPADSEQL